MINKTEYRRLCAVEEDIPIFSKDWWLDATCGADNWDVVISKSGNEVVGTLPFYKTRKFSLTLLKMPLLTQKLGPWIKYPQNQKYEKRLSHEKKIMNDLISQLPHFDLFQQSFDYSITNWLPFYWNKFKQTTRYTYVIDDLSNLDNVFQEFKSSVRGKTRKAEKLVTITSEKTLEDFYLVNKMTFERQKIKIPYSYKLIEEKDKALSSRNSRKIFFAVDEQERIHSALYLIWDSRSSYVHMVGEDPDLRNSGAGSLLIWEAIQFTKNQLKLNCFDFEGSMIEGVEEVRRAFGAIQKPYFEISKINSPALKAYDYFTK